MADPIGLWTNGRDLEEESTVQQRYYYVAEHNDLITKARHDLTVQELKVMDYVISMIKPSDTELHVINTSMNKIINVLDLKRSGGTYNQIAKNLASLRQKSVYIYNEEEKSVTMTGWLERAKVWEEGQVEVRINPDFAPYLLELKENYTQHLLQDTVKLSSKYAILLYKLMREADKSYGQKIAILAGTPEEFKEWLGAPESYAWKHLRVEVIEKAIKQINERIDDMDLEMFTAKKGRRIAFVEIHNKFTRKGRNEKPDHQRAL